MDTLTEQIKRMQNLMGLNESVGSIHTLYHAILKNKFNSFEELMHEIFTNGLKPNDNGEVGNAIWFATNNEYADDTRELSFTIDYNEQNREHYKIVVDPPNAWVYSSIPFNELKVYTVPVMKIRGQYLNNKQALKFFQNLDEQALSKWLKYGPTQMYFFEGIFQQTVQPFCKTDILGFLKSQNPDYINTEFNQYKFHI